MTEDLLTNISICMPYYNRYPQLRRSLNSIEDVYLEHVDFDDPPEIVICDDGSSPPLGLLETYFTVQIIRLPESPPLNPCVPINEAVETASSDIIVLTNPEIEHREPVLLEMMEMLQHEDDYVVARCYDDELGWIADSSVDYSKSGRLPVPPGAHFHFCAMMHESLFWRAGGFDEDYRFGQACEDNDWLWRLHRVGANFKLTHGTVYHHRTGVKWGRPHNRELFFQKWPDLR